ncbi:hypothetical protein EB796_011922 [Bugula neritina]|uniref:PKD/REJ-like domain-containing protein n=1 Tax=Bugula neritina TaxID=10212 RepID=A0A7J7JVM9_BUGNE|nr:hypothetical protein EB796_011922 [Bugula neritina]
MRHHIASKLVFLERRAGPCLLSLTDTDGSTSFVSFSDYQDVVDAKSIIELPEFSLSTNTKYQFTLTYKKNDRSSATKEIAVEVKEGSPPKVSIDEIEGSHNPNKDLVIAGSVLSPLDFAVTWSCVEGEGYEVLDVEAFSNANGKNYGGNGRAVSVALVVAAEFLKPGATYKFELDATHFDNFAVAALEVTVNAAPQCTDVTNTGGTSGTALTDEFTAVMEGCDDDETDFPLTYRFYTVDVDNSDKVTYLTAESQLASEISTKLSAGVRKFGCQVCDINKACADYVSDTEITLSNSDFTTSNIDQILEDAGDDVALGGESPLISQVLDNVESMDDPTDEVKEMVVTLGDMLTSSTLSGINAQDDPDGGLDKLSYTTETTEQTKSVAGSSALSEGSQEQMKAKTAEVAEFKINPEQGGDDTVSLLNSSGGIAETDIISEDAVTFIELLESVWQGVCAGQVEGQDAEVGR